MAGLGGEVFIVIHKIKKPKVIIYGFNRQAQQMKHYFEKDECADVCAYIADREYITFTSLDGMAKATGFTFRK